MTTIEDVLDYAYEAGNMERRMCIDKARGFDVRNAYNDLRAAIEQYAAERVAELQSKVGMAYGYLWCVNNEPGTPNQYPPERAAYEARKLLRDTITKEERGRYINAVLPLVRDRAEPQKEQQP